jgi:dTDP-4-amino-4,6-dideoxygalactose transaminase
VGNNTKDVIRTYYTTDIPKMAKTHIIKTIFRSTFRPSKETALEPVEELKNTLEDYFNLKVFPVNSGRSALYLILKAANIGVGDEVIIQAYTCNAVPNPILWLGARPIYADIDPDTLNLDPKAVEARISKKTKAIILQHTFGRPGPLQELQAIAKKHDLLLIEDCAHSLGATYNSKRLGTFGDGAILSFGREKVISSLAGGAVIIKNQKLVKPTINLTSELKPIPFKRMSHEFLNFFAWRLLLRRVYFRDMGLKFIRGLNKHDFFNVVTSQKELVGEQPKWYPSATPNVLAQIALEEFADLNKYNDARREIADLYLEKIKNPEFNLLSNHEGIYLRFVALHKKAHDVYKEARKKGFWFGNWYNTPVYPKGIDEEKLGYKSGSCPNAEKCAEMTVNLPNFLGMSTTQTEEIIDFINNYK